VCEPIVVLKKSLLIINNH